MAAYESDKDLRAWIQRLDEAGHLSRVTSEVDLHGEVAAICRRVLNEQGPALLFDNISGHEESWCRRLFTGGLGSKEKVALLFDLPEDTPRRVLVERFRDALHNPISPRIVDDGPVKENIITGEDIDVNQIPVPFWHHLDKGRYINTWCGVVTRDPDTGDHNVGMYRGVVATPDKIGVLLLLSQHWGHHFMKYAQRGEPMPVAVVYGWDPSLGFCAASQIPPDVSEYDVMGAIKQEPVQLVKCETSDILVPASAEIVVEGYIDARNKVEEGPFGEYTGYYGGSTNKRYALQVTSIAHRDDPIYRGNLEGAGPGEPNEDSHVYAVSSKGIMQEVLERAGIPGVLDVRPGPINIVKIKQMYRGQAKQVANALWGSWASEWMWKVLMVVDDDINIYNERSLQWAFCYRVDPLKHDVVIMPNTRGGSLDPSNTESERDDMVFGTGQWNRILIDALLPLGSATRNEFGLPVWEPLSTFMPEEWVDLVESRWDEYGIALPDGKTGDPPLSSAH